MNVQLAATDLTWRHIGTIDDIRPQSARKLRWGDMTIAVFRTGADAIFALEDRCPHRNGPLSEGIVHDGCVTCPLHNWVISLEDGTAQGADEGRVRRFPVRLDGRDIYISLG